jgi:ribosome-associated protein
MIPVTDRIALDERLITESFVRASGPGGQNVNKVATAVQLRFDSRAAALPEAIWARLKRLAGKRMTQDGVIVITAQRHRSQDRNREDALARLVELVRRAAIPPTPRRPTPRRPTKPTYASTQRRLEAKARRSRVKGERGRRPVED